MGVTKQQQDQVRAAIAQYLVDNPDQTYDEVAKALGCSSSTIANIAIKYKVSRRHVFNAGDVALLAIKGGK